MTRSSCTLSEACLAKILRVCPCLAAMFKADLITANRLPGPDNIAQEREGLSLSSRFALASAHDSPATARRVLIVISSTTDDDGEVEAKRKGRLTPRLVDQPNGGLVDPAGSLSAMSEHAVVRSLDDDMATARVRAHLRTTQADPAPTSAWCSPGAATHGLGHDAGRRGVAA